MSEIEAGSPMADFLIMTVQESTEKQREEERILDMITETTTLILAEVNTEIIPEERAIDEMTIEETKDT